MYNRRMGNTCLFTQLVRLVLLISLVGFVFGCHESERVALSKFNQSVNDTESQLTSWNGTDCCNWQGVGCDNVTGYVNRLSLHRFYLVSQELDLSLVDLKHLRYLDLSDNDFSESKIPEFISSFKELRYLDLSDANFSGVVSSQFNNLSSLKALSMTGLDLQIQPHWASGLVNLKYLDLSDASITLAPKVSLLQTFNDLPSLLDLRVASISFPNNHSITLFPYAPTLFSNFTWISRIQHLDLSQSNFEITFSQIFTEMNSLEYLDLSVNHFSDSILLQLRNMSKLKYLDLSQNNFTGRIPTSLGNLSYLEELDFSYNGLHGPIPRSIQELLPLKSLRISNNFLNGNIPQWLGRLKTLEIIDLSSNSLQGVLIESHFANLSNLNFLDLSFNSLDLNIANHWVPPFQLSELLLESCDIHSQFPGWIRTQTNLSLLDLSDNFIFGSFPHFASSQLSSIDLSYNSISGPLLHPFPSALEELYISHNHITGPFPHFPSSQLQILDLSYNSISGPLLHPFVEKAGESLCNISNLNILELEGNKISGSIPNCLGDMDLETINLSYNQISGIIPMSFGNNSYLANLYLNNNALEGIIPPNLDLQTLDLGENELSGTIPGFDGSLDTLRLRGNKLVGGIPPQLCNLVHLTFLDLADNNLTGSIPHCLGYVTGMRSIVSDASTISLTASAISLGQRHCTPDRCGRTLPKDMNATVVLNGREQQYSNNDLELVVILDLSCNHLTGSIPLELMQLTKLIGLNLSHNHLTGCIPEKIGDMQQLQSLDLSNNHLSGTIPSTISALTFLEHLNMSYNDLHGLIPSGNQLQVLDDPSTIYMGNPKLCGDPLPRSCNSKNDNQHHQPEEQDKEDNRDKALFYGIIMIGVATGFWGMVGSLMVSKRFNLGLFRLVEDVVDYLHVLIVVWINTQ